MLKDVIFLAIDQFNDNLSEEDRSIYEMLKVCPKPFENVKYFYPNSINYNGNTYAKEADLRVQVDADKAFFYKYIYSEDKNKLDMLFANVEDSTGTMDAILSEIMSDSGDFAKIQNWGGIN